MKNIENSIDLQPGNKKYSSITFKKMTLCHVNANIETHETFVT